MRVYCPNCGTDNEGLPGGRVTCLACTASFEVPREPGPAIAPPEPQPSPLDATSRPAGPPPPRKVVPPPARPLHAAPQPPPGPRPSAPPAVMPGYVGPPPSGFGVSGLHQAGQTNPLAIVSLVAGLVCCIPFSGTAAVVTGIIARNQIAASQGAQKGAELAMVGIVLGALSILFSVGYVVLMLVAGLAQH